MIPAHHLLQVIRWDEQPGSTLIIWLDQYLSIDITRDRGLIPLLMIIWGLWCQKQLSQAGMNNRIPRYSVGCNYVPLPEIPVSGTKVLIWYMGSNWSPGAQPNIEVMVEFQIQIKYVCLPPSQSKHNGVLHIARQLCCVGMNNQYSYLQCCGTAHNIMLFGPCYTRPDCIIQTVSNSAYHQTSGFFLALNLAAMFQQGWCSMPHHLVVWLVYVAEFIHHWRTWIQF